MPGASPQQPALHNVDSSTAPGLQAPDTIANSLKDLPGIEQANKNSRKVVGLTAARSIKPESRRETAP